MYELAGFFWIVVLLILLALSAFFSGSETAVTAVSRIKIRTLSEKNNKSARILDTLLQKPGRLITTLLIGNNIVNIASASIATALAITYLESYFLNNVALVTTVAAIVMTVVLLVFGEIIPKNFAINRAEKVSLFVARAIDFVVLVLSPLSAVLSYFSMLLTRLFGGTMLAKGSLVTEDELKMILMYSEKEGILERDEKEMIQGIFDLGKSIVREIMTPRTDIVCAEMNETVSDVIIKIRESGHSRIPVYKERLDFIKGIVLAKDLLQVNDKDWNMSVSQFLRKAYFVPDTKKVDELLKQMKKTKNHIAIVIDEYGGVCGVISFEDILEEIVGDIQDEFEGEDVPQCIKVADDTYEVQASINIYELNQEVRINLPEGQDYDTLAGFLISIAGRIPKEQEIIQWHNLSFRVMSQLNNRIIKVQLKITRDHEEKNTLQ